jgi:hypothetical protein
LDFQAVLLLTVLHILVQAAAAQVAAVAMLPAEHKHPVVRVE